MDSGLYKIMRNYIHNELKMSKDEIKELIVEVAKKEVARLITPELVSSMVDKSVDTTLKQSLSERGHYGDSFREKVTQLVAKEAAQFVKSQLKFEINVNGERANIDTKHTGAGTTRIIEGI